LQYYNRGTATVNVTQLVKNLEPTLGSFITNGIWNFNAANAAVVDYSDTRTGMGPMIETQGTWTGIEKVDLVGVVHYDMLKQPIGATQSNQNSWEKLIMVAPTQLSNWVSDYTEKINTDGESTISNVNVGGKVEFKALDNMKLALGGFIYSNTQVNDFSKVAVTRTRTVTYSDGLVGDTPGGVGIAAIPGPAVATAGFGNQIGAGEGTWTQTSNDEINGQTKTETVTYSIPVGIEMPIYKDKWVFRAGTGYTMVKQKTTTTAGIKTSQTVTTVTPAGGATVTNKVTNTANAGDESTAAYVETHTTTYTYGVQWNVNKNMTLAMNAVLDTNPNSAVTGGAGSAVKASLLDLDTYRLLSIQAVIHF
jgi:hypothetical protein